MGSMSVTEIIIRGVIGGIAGAGLGYLYYRKIGRHIGCNSGLCMLSINPYLSLVFGAVIGAMMVIVA
jgi:hypothetical protein